MVIPSREDGEGSRNPEWITLVVCVINDQWVRSLGALRLPRDDRRLRNGPPDDRFGASPKRATTTSVSSGPASRQFPPGVDSHRPPPDRRSGGVRGDSEPP